MTDKVNVLISLGFLIGWFSKCLYDYAIKPRLRLARMKKAKSNH